MVERYMAAVRKTKHRARKKVNEEALVLNTKPVDSKYHVPINTAGVTWGAKRPFPPPDWNHWKVFGMKPTMDREAVIARYHSVKEMTWEIGVAYGRILSELWTKGIKPKHSSLEEWDPKAREQRIQSQRKG